MNNKRRAQIKKIIEELSAIQGRISCICDDEQEYLDNIPDNLQGSVRYDTASEAVDTLSEAADAIDEVSETLSNAL